MKKAVFLLIMLPFIFASSCKKEIDKSEAISAIPARSTFVVRINDLHQLAEDLNQSIPGSSLKKSFVFTELDEFIQLMDEHRIDKEQHIKAFGGYDQYGAGTFGWIWTLDAEVLPFVTKTILGAKGEVTSREYGSSEIVYFKKDGLEFYFAHKGGLLLLSKRENLVESGLKQLESGIDLTGDARFMHTFKTTNSKDPVNVFVQFRSLPDWLSTILLEKPTWPGDLARWSAIDLDINENDINLTGISLTTDSSATYLNLFNGTGSGSNRFEEIIPQNTAMMLSQTCGDLNTWQQNLSVFLGKKNKLKKRNSQLTALGVDAKEWMSFIDEEIGVFYTDDALPVAESKNGFIRIKDEELAQNKLDQASGNFLEVYRELRIKKINKRHALPLVFGKIFSHLSEPYWFKFNNWIIVCNDLSSAKSTINNLLADKIWQTDNSFESISASRDRDANLLVIARNPEWTHLKSKELKDDLSKQLMKEKESFNAINWAMAQLKYSGDAAYTELLLINQTQASGNAKQYWGKDLEAPAITTPQLVLNHYTKENEVVIQDEKHNLYLIDSKGKVLWKRTLEGKILGEIEQVDLYKNNKLQMVFNTHERFYLIDRNGKDVGGFPVKLPARATAPMAAFDYENNRKYRFVVPCGKQLYNYNGDGQKVKGWSFKKAKASIIQQPKHAVIGSKDFIYTVDAKGNVYVLNRRGEIREPIKNKLNNLASDVYLVGDKNEGGKLNSLSKSGYTLSLFLKDQLDSLQPFNENPSFMTVAGKTQIFAAENELYVRSESFNFDVELDEEIIEEPKLYKVGNKLYITVSTNENQIWIFNKNGEALSGMPLYGDGIATIGKTSGNEIHAIVATKEGSLLDYKLSE